MTDTPQRVPRSITTKRKIIAYSLFGGLQGAVGFQGMFHPAMEYIMGAHLNCIQAKRLYPEWMVRLYVDDKMPQNILGRLMNHDNIEFVLVHDPFSATRNAKEHNYFGTLWRFLPYDDPNVEMFLSRDLDDLLDEDGRRCLGDWVENGAMVAHRQSAPDAYLVNAGWFGLKRGGLPRGWSMRQAIRAWCIDDSGPKDTAYCTDERFPGFDSEFES